MEGQSVEVALHSDEMQSRPRAQILNGANTGLLLAQWRREGAPVLDEEEIGLNRWKLTRASRGHFETEQAASVVKNAETPFIWLDGAVVAVCKLRKSDLNSIGVSATDRKKYERR